MHELRDATLELLWSLWTELGVPGAVRRHQTVAVDPEPLIAWTPLLASADPRLLGLAFDWCAANADQIAKVRLPGLAKAMPENAIAALASFNAALGRYRVDWRPRGTPSSLTVSRSIVALPIERPALVRFRIRALCGASIRAEVLAALLAAGDHDVQVADIVPSGSSRRSVERILNELAAATLVASQGGQRRQRFRLHDLHAFEAALKAAGLRWVDLPKRCAWSRRLGRPNAKTSMKS